MDCPQCGAGVPPDDAFCGKCGYAMRDRVPERLDQSRIRVHEEPDPVPEDTPSRASSHQRLRKHTVLGMPSLTPAGARPSPQDRSASEPEPPPPTPPPPQARRTPARTPQKTKLGLPQLEVPVPEEAGSPGAPPSTDLYEPLEREGSAPPGISSGPPPSHRARARVRYDSSNEPLSVTQRRLKALRVLGVMVLLAAAWLGYRFLTLHG